MVTDFDSVMAADLAAVEGELSAGNTWTWDGDDYPGMVGDITQGRSLGLPGYVAEAAAVILARTAALTSGTPAVHDLVTVGGTVYRVQEVVPSADGISVWIALEERDE